MTKRILSPLVLLAAVGLLVRTVSAESLPSDPRIVTGKLDNGVTWMYRQHDNPPGKMALMIHVDTGSLNETDAQRGLAHFMEHMTFNGSENFPPGALIPYFESIGMEFGADLNAFTSFDQTCYMIFLPNTEREQIDRALMVLSDQAFRCLLLEEEIDKERPVILAEKRAGMSAQQRIRDKLWPDLFTGSRFAERIPIGLEEIIKNATRDDFVDYYRTWYRPERVTVLMVGDTELEPIVPLLEKQFGRYQAPVPAQNEHGPEFKPFTEQRALLATDPEYAGCQVAMYNIRPGRPPTTTVALARQDLIETLGSWIVHRRLDERIKKGEASYHTARAVVFNFFNDALLAVGLARGEPQNWEKMLDELVTEIGRAREYGFTAHEFDLAQRELTAEAERAVRIEPTRNARGLIREMCSAVNDGEPIMSAAQELELLQRLLPTIKLEEVSAAFAKHFEPGMSAYVVTMPEKDDVKVPARDEVLAAARAALAKKVEPPKDEQRATELLASLPEPGKVVETTRDDELGITSFWLENGVRVHHRFMDYKKDLVLISITLAGGQIEETAANAGISEVATLAFGQAATQELTSTEITDIMTGKNISVGAGASGDAFVVSVSGSPKDLEIGLQLAHVLLTDGKIEQSAFDKWKEESLQRYEMYSKMPPFQAIKNLWKLISGDDPRLTVKDPDRINAQSVDAAQAWLKRLRREAPIEVAIVGEIKQDEVMPLIERYIGSLPKRPRSAKHLDPLRRLDRPEGPLTEHVSVETITPQAMVICGFIGTEARLVREAQALELASKTLDSRLIKRVREELGLVYSIGVQQMPARVYRDAGMFLTGAPCAPDKPDEVVKEVDAIFAAFAEEGPTAEELANAKKQVLNNLDTQMKEPRFWLGKLQHADLHQVDLDEFKRMKESYAGFTAEQVRDVFRKYYVPAREFHVMAVPAGQPAELPAGEAAPQVVPVAP